MSDDTGYDLDDPKHPTYYERYADHADMHREYAKENRADPKDPPRVKDPEMYKQFHRLGHECVSCGNRHVSFAHLLRGAEREDVLAAGVPLCGGGSSGCHGCFDSGHSYIGDFGHKFTPREVKAAVARFIRSEAGDDQREYLNQKLGPFGAEAYCLKLEEAK